MCVCVCVCVCVRACVRACVCVCVCSLLGDNGRLQYLRFCLLKCMLMGFFCHHLFVQRSEFNSG